MGPIVVARSPRQVGGRVAIPGERTTAALLLTLLGRFDTVPMRFDQIEQAVLRGDVDCGVLIHEGRFTYQAKGLALLEDLGAVWEAANEVPAAAGGDRDPPRHGGGARRRRWIARCARASSTRSRTPLRALNMSGNTRRKWTPRSPRKHIQLYVNDYTVALDEHAVNALLDWQRNWTTIGRSDIAPDVHLTDS